MRPTEPRLEDHLAASEPKAARFLKLLLVLIGVALALLGGFNYLVDPYSIYGSPLGLQRPRPVRLAKLDLLRAADPPPEALILGSSRVRMLPPVSVKRLFGLQAFHLGGPKSSPQNWLSLTRYAVDDLGYPIRLVIVGVDPSSFVDVTTYLQHPAEVPELRRHLRYPRFSQFRSWAHLWSPAQTKASLAFLSATTRSRGPAEAGAGRWDKDGFVLRSLPLDAGEITETAISLHRSRGVVEGEHLEDFEAFVEFATERRITIVAYVTPETPELARALQGTHFPETKRATREILRKAEGKGLVYCEVESLAFQNEDFVDPHHPTAEAGARLLEALSVCARDEGVD
ncbi:MAG: hypothetical protein ACSLFQ_01455 [Thermoanaerobaculia bacterium]